LVQGNRIGTDTFGTAPLGNDTGVSIRSASNTVGGAVAGAGNLISGNTGDGVVIQGSGATANLVQGNRIGTDLAGSAALSNVRGVEIFGGPGNTGGGSTPAAGNLISGNTDEGVLIQGSGATFNLLLSNRIGTDASGTARLGNGTGVEIRSDANTVGGTAAGTGNLISGNTDEGV